MNLAKPLLIFFIYFYLLTGYKYTKILVKKEMPLSFFVEIQHFL